MGNKSNKENNVTNDQDLPNNFECFSEKLNIIRNGLKQNCLYCDPEFPADSSSLWYNSATKNGKDIVWKRAKDIITDACLLSDKKNIDDIIQGECGDCWFLVACAAIAQQENLVNNLIPLDQPLFGGLKDAYFGALMCRIWQFGEWTEIIIDDFLPTRSNELVFARCAVKDEFWISYLEKAFAKLYGTYDALDGGNSTDALVDLTGGIAELYEIDKQDDKHLLFKYLLKAYKENAFMTCSVNADKRDTNQSNSLGLVGNHAYTIKGVFEIRNEADELIRLLKIRNPWRNSIEWKGSYSDNDVKWKKLVDKNKDLKDVYSPNENDGEFFMCLEDFCTYFKDVSICTLGPDFRGDFTVNSTTGWFKLIKGIWIGSQTAGGSRNDIESFSKNPQFLIELIKPRKEERTTSTMIISLMQDYRKSARNSHNIKLFQIGYIIYKIDSLSQINQIKKLDANYLQSNSEYAKSGNFVDYREVTKRFELPFGYYIIIPCTFQPNQISKFVIRLHSEHNFIIRELE